MIKLTLYPKKLISVTNKKRIGTNASFPNFVFSQKIAMTSPLKLQLCQEDPPQFRKELAVCENSVFGLENTIKNLVKLARSNVELASG